VGRVRHLGRAVVGSAVLAAGLLGVGATAAAASPTNAPTALTGTFFCPSDGVTARSQ
jgi:hypothetical protein